MSKNFSDKLLVKVTGMGVDLRKLADKRMLNPILSMLEDLKKELAATLERVDPTAVVRASAQQARVKALFDQTTETIRSGYKDIVKAHAADLRTLASVQAELIGGTINNLVGVEIMTTTLSGQQLSSIASNVMIKGAPSREWWSRQAGDLRERFQDAIRDGMLRGETLSDLTRRVRGTRESQFSDGVFVPGALNPDGIISTATRNAQALIRTSVQTVANDARIALYEENQDVCDGIEWHNVLDDRTTPPCEEYDGKKWSFPDYEPIGHDLPFPGPTLHWGCRCTQIAVLKSFASLMKSGALPKTERKNETLASALDGEGATE